MSCMRVNMCTGMSAWKNAPRNVCLPVGLSRGVSATPWAANKGAFARVCVCTLKPSKCSWLLRDPSTWLKRHTSLVAIFPSPSLWYVFYYSSHLIKRVRFYPLILASVTLSVFVTYAYSAVSSLCSSSTSTGCLLCDICHVHACVITEQNTLQPHTEPQGYYLTTSTGAFCCPALHSVVQKKAFERTPSCTCPGSYVTHLCWFPHF